MDLGKRRQTPFRKLQEQLKLADIVFELRDARAPQSTGHPMAIRLFGRLPRIIVLSHLDLADAKSVSNWSKSAVGKSDPIKVIATSLKHLSNKAELINTAQKLAGTRSQRHGVLPRPIRACVVGLPNVGKSTFINWILGRKKAHTGNKPGITRATQWIRVSPRFELLDTPGILPPAKFDRRTNDVLALINILAEKQYEPEEIALWAIQYLSLTYPSSVLRYGLDTQSHIYLLEQIATLKNFRAKNNAPDCLRAATAFIQDVRNGVLGRLFFDLPSKNN
jgi:ribosome biogenesis GTPase A